MNAQVINNNNNNNNNNKSPTPIPGRLPTEFDPWRILFCVCSTAGRSVDLEFKDTVEVDMPLLVGRNDEDDDVSDLLSLDFDA